MKLVIRYIICVVISQQLLPSITPNNLPTDLSAFGELLTVEPTAVVQMQYVYGILNPNYVSTTGANGGTVTTSTNFALLSTGTGATGIAQLSSNHRLHYKPAQGCASLFTALFSTGATGSSQKIGVGNIVPANSMTIQDGFFYGYFNGTSYNYDQVTVNGTYNGTTFGIMHTCNGFTNFYPQSSWNVDNLSGGGGSANPSGINLNPTFGNVYKIQYQWLGFGAIKFYIENPTTGVLTLVHIIQYANANTRTSLLNPSLQLLAQVSKTSGSSNITLKNPSFAGFIEGYINSSRNERNTILSSTAAYTIPNNSPTFNNILTIKNETTFNGMTNQIAIFPDWISLINNAAGTTEIFFNFYLNPTFATPPTYETINTVLGTTTSVVSFASSGTGTGTGYGQVSTVSGGTLLFSTYVVGGTSLLFSLSDLGIILEPGDVLCIAATRITGTGTALASISWLEEF